MKCWICNINNADSGEHSIKKSDLARMYPNSSQKSPIYQRKNGKKKKPIGSIKAKTFKFKKVICEDCNNSKTQKYDKSWEKLSGFLDDNWNEILESNSFDINKLFSSDIPREMINIQLFFIKILGCKIAESSNNIGLESFSSALNKTEEHPHVYISFRDSTNNYTGNYTANADVELSKDKNGNMEYIHWFYVVGNFAVDVIYTMQPKEFDLNGAKKPSEMSNIIKLSTLNYDQTHRKS